MNDLDRMYQDIVAAAQLAGVPYSRTVITQTLKAFKGFSRGAVQFRTTTKPLSHRRLDVRYEELESPEMPLDVARRAGWLHDQGRDMDRLIPQCYQRFPYMADGVDVDVAQGVTKVWFFTLGGHPVEQAFSLSAMPRSVAAHAAYYDKYQLNTLCVVGVDYVAQSMNIYLRLDKPSHHTPEMIRGMVDDLGFGTPPSEAVQHSLQGVSIALTYRWDSAHIERICFYVPCPNREMAPRSFHPLIGEWVDKVPVLKTPMFLFSWTFGAKGSYIKLENDYTGNVFSVIGRALSDEVPAATQ